MDKSKAAAAAAAQDHARMIYKMLTEAE